MNQEVEKLVQNQLDAEARKTAPVVIMRLMPGNRLEQVPGIAIIPTDTGVRASVSREIGSVEVALMLLGKGITTLSKMLIERKEAEKDKSALKIEVQR